MPQCTPSSLEFVDNQDGWGLALRRYVRASGADPTRPPLLFVPGYAMNSFILAYHPRGRSLVEYLADQGFEVWTVNLRAQGDSRRTGPHQRFGMGELALVDLPAALDAVQARTRSRHPQVDVAGCSLGASLVYGYLAHHRQDHPIRRLVSMGGPLRWDEVHPLLRLAFRSATVAGLVPIRSTRRMARNLLPVLKRFPALLSPYMNARRVDLTQADQLVNTVEDPVRYINRQVARWVQGRDLQLRGVNTSEALAGLPLDVLVVLANRDGIVPPAAACSVQQILGTGRVDVLRAGDDVHWYAHADLFIGDEAEQAVFEPMAAWLQSALDDGERAGA